MQDATRLSDTDAASLAAQLFGITATASPLPSERDQNVLLRAADGRAYVLKRANVAESRALLEAECAALHHIAPLGLCPAVMPNADGEEIASHDGHFIRLISVLPGRTLGSTPLHTDALRRNIGRALGRLDRALTTFDHPACHRDFHWDLANASAVVAAHHHLVRDPITAAHIAAFAARHEAQVVPALGSFRRSVIHSDANDYNILVDETLQSVTGIIDFGDMVYSHTVNDVAIAMAYVALSSPEDPLAAAAAVVSGYHQTHPLTEPEIAALFSLMCMRLCVSACMAAKQSADRPDDDYLAISQGPIATTLPILARIHPRFAHYTFRDACGLVPVPHATHVTEWLAAHATTFAPLLGRDLRTTPVAPLDFSAGSTLLSSDPAGNEPAALDSRIQRVLADHGAIIGAGGYDEARLIYHWPNEPTSIEPRTIHVGLDLSLAPGSPLYAPLDGVVHGFEDADHHHDYGPLIVLRHSTGGDAPVEFFSFYGHLTRDSLNGLVVGQSIAKGTEFARIGSAPTNGNWWSHVHVQLATDMLDVPCNLDGAVRASQRRVWKSVFPDPNLILGIPHDRLTQHRPKAAIAASRRAHVGGNLSISYGANPLNIVRGYRRSTCTTRMRTASSTATTTSPTWATATRAWCAP
ncbi:MAG: phosphotransferase [Gemmatimonadaceae bacterium]|nr:phosphotransferase [Gemmatimonadaceae bacterium]